MRSHPFLRALVLLLLSLSAPSLLRGDSFPEGKWQARLIPSPGYDVAFEIRIQKGPDALKAVLMNGASSSPFTAAAWDGTTLTLDLAHFDARISAKRKGDDLEGTFTRQIATGAIEIPFAASKRRLPAPALTSAATPVDGTWGIEIEEGKGVTRTTGFFHQSGAAVTGTMREATGDYGPLHGTFDGTHLVLQVFDGVHIYRFDGTIQSDGALDGEFRSRNNPPSHWRGRRVTARAAEADFPDGFGVVKARNPAKPYEFSFQDADGRTVSSEDPRFLGKPMIVAFMGTWCPNCNDEAPVLREIHRKFHSRGLEIVALSFEYTDDMERSRRQVKRFKERYATPYDVLIAGTTKDAPASVSMTQLDGWKGYPTTIFLDRQHRIAKIHSGFDGPATGEHHTRLKKEMDETVVALLK